MNTYNADKFISESINSVLSQTYSNWELIIFDNCSNDLTNEIISKYEDTRIKYILSNSHTHLGIARYEAEKYLDGEYLGILDSDDIWLPDKIEKQLPYLKEAKEVGLVYSNTIFFNNNYEKKLYNSHQPSGYLFQKLLFNYNISLESILIKRSCITKLDYFFNPKYQLISDFDLILRISKKFKIVYVPYILSKWRLHNSNSSKGKLFSFIKEKKDWVENNKNILNSKITKKIQKHLNIDKSLLLICQSNFNDAEIILKKNPVLSIKYFFVFYILKIKLFRELLINLYKRRINFNELV